MASKISSFDEKIKLPVTETISRFYQPQPNRKAIRILTVAVYVLCVSLAAIMLSLYYIFIWDPTVKPFMPKVANCDKIIIPEQIAIRLTNYTEISADQFYKNILQHYQQQQSKRKNLKYRKNFILNLYTTSTTTTTTTTVSPNKQLLSIDEDINDKSKSLSSITSTISTIPDEKSTLSSSTSISKNYDINVDDDDVLIPEDNSSEMKLQFLSITPKQKILEPYMKSSLEMHKNRKVNSDDEDYTDEFGEASGGYIMDIS